MKRFLGFALTLVFILGFASVSWAPPGIPTPKWRSKNGWGYLIKSGLGVAINGTNDNAPAWIDSTGNASFKNISAVTISPAPAAGPHLFFSSSHSDLNSVGGLVSGVYYSILYSTDGQWYLDTTTTSGAGDFLADGSVTMTGDLNMGAQALTNVGNVDGVDVSAHATSASTHHAADNLGNHTATQALDMGAYGITDTGPITGATTGSFSGTVTAGSLTMNGDATFGANDILFTEGQYGYGASAAGGDITEYVGTHSALSSSTEQLFVGSLPNDSLWYDHSGWAAYAFSGAIGDDITTASAQELSAGFELSRNPATSSSSATMFAHDTPYGSSDYRAELNVHATVASSQIKFNVRNVADNASFLVEVDGTPEFQLFSATIPLDLAVPYLFASVNGSPLGTGINIKSDFLLYPGYKHYYWSSNSLSAANNPSVWQSGGTLGFENESGAWQAFGSGGAETNTLETTITGIESGEIFYGTGSNAGAFTAHNFARVADSVQDAQIVAAIARDSELFGGSFSDLAGSIADAQVPTDITIDLATAASALNANPTNCAAGSYARGIAADGTAEDCTAAGSGSAPIAGTNISVSGQTVSVVGAPSFAGTVTAPNFVSSASTHALNVNNSTAPTGTFLSVGDIYTLNGEPYVAVDGTTKSVIYRAGGTDVADADIVAAIMRDSEWTAATLTAEGKVELATTTETITGTDATRAVTPDGLTDALASAGVVDWTTDQGATNIHSGNVPLAATATALAANGGNCAAGEIPLGVDISGAVEGCYEPAEADITDLVHTATGITDGLIVEADLNADEAPTDNDILTYDTTGANFSWQTPAELNIYYSGGTDVPVADGGTGTSTLTDGGILLGSGTGAITALAVATNGQIPIGDGATDPVLATITPGAGIDVTNGAGTITIDGETATLTNPGIAEFATTAEHITGTDATRAATPDGVTAALEASTKDWATTGTINGLVNVTSTTAATLALTAATCASDLHVNGDNDVVTYTLPTAVAGQNCGFLTPFDAAVTVDPANTGDSIILGGTTLSAGDAASSSASAGAYAYFLAINASQWVVIGSIKMWAGP